MWRGIGTQLKLSLLDKANLPNLFQVITESDVDEINCQNTVDPDDEEEHW